MTKLLSPIRIVVRCVLQLVRLYSVVDDIVGVVVAQLSRKTANFLTGKQRLSITVSPGMDMAVIAAMSFEFVKRVMNR